MLVIFFEQMLFLIIVCTNAISMKSCFTVSTLPCSASYLSSLLLSEILTIWMCHTTTYKTPSRSYTKNWLERKKNWAETKKKNWAEIKKNQIWVETKKTDLSTNMITNSFFRLSLALICVQFQIHLFLYHQYNVYNAA